MLCVRCDYKTLKHEITGYRAYLYNDLWRKFFYFLDINKVAYI